NAYFRPLTFDRLDRPTTIQVLHPDDVTVSPDRNNLYPVYTWRGRPMARNRDIFHIAVNLYPGQFTGLGPIAAARTLWTTMKAEANFQRQLIVDNAVPGGILHSQKPLTATEAEEVRDVWESSHQGRKRIGVTSGVIEFKPLNIDPVDAQFIEARNFSVQEVGRLFGLSGFFLGVDSGSSMTYSTTESLFRLFLTQTLRPTYLERIEQAFSLILPRGRAARFNVDEILRPDIQTRYQAHEIALRAGFKTPNEVRAEEGYGPLPGGDTIQPAQTPAPAQSNGNGRIGTLA